MSSFLLNEHLAIDKVLVPYPKPLGPGVLLYSDLKICIVFCHV